MTPPRAFTLGARARVEDAARLLPIFGAVLMLLPLWWPVPRWGLWWIFGLWLVLIMAAAVLAPKLGRIAARRAKEAQPRSAHLRPPRARAPSRRRPTKRHDTDPWHVL